jgi:hypothetical protein
MLKFTFKDGSTKNSEPTYWTTHFVMLKIYFIYKVAGKKIQKGYIKLNYVVCLSETGSSCLGVTDRTCKQELTEMSVSYIKYMSLCSLLWFQH